MKVSIATTTRFMLRVGASMYTFYFCHIYTRYNIYYSCFFQSMGSFFRDRGYTLGNLMGISSFLELSRRSNRTRIDQTASRNHQHQKNLKSYKPWIFSICSKLSTHSTIIPHNKITINEYNRRNNVQSLGHFLMVERRAIGSTSRSTPTM